MLGGLAWALYSRPARTSMRNIEFCFPELAPKEQRALARESLCETARVAMESAILWYWQQPRIEALFREPEGIEHVHDAMKRGGVLLACPHLGNWEFLTYSLAVNFGITALYQARHLGAYERCVVEARFRFGGEMVEAGGGGLRAVVRALRSGGVVAILPDQVPTRGKGVIANFMGMKAVTGTLFHELVLRSGAEPIHCVCRRVDGGFQVSYTPIEGGIRDPDPVIGCQALNDAIEAATRISPSQYQWEYKRFRRVETYDVYR